MQRNVTYSINHTKIKGRMVIYTKSHKRYNIGGKNMDRITQSMMDSFKSNQSLNIDDDSELF